MNEPHTHLPPGVEAGRSPGVQTPLSPEVEADLVALAGNLSPVRRLEVEARVAAEPALAAALEQQRAALSLLAELTQPAPLAIRRRVCELRSRRRQIRLRRWLPVGLRRDRDAPPPRSCSCSAAARPRSTTSWPSRYAPPPRSRRGAEQLEGLRFPRPDRLAGGRRAR